MPLAVIECKSPYVNEPLAQAIDQLQRYANQRDWVAAEEGNERLLWTNQPVVNRREETANTETMLAWVMDRFSMSPQRLAGDTAYGTGRLLRWLADRKITPHIPV
jgi:hypothetical protein